MIDGFVRFVDSGACGPINLGNSEISIGALAGSRSRIEPKPLPGDDPARRRPDIRRARERAELEPVRAAAAP